MGYFNLYKQQVLHDSFVSWPLQRYTKRGLNNSTCKYIKLNGVLAWLFMNILYEEYAYITLNTRVQHFHTGKTGKITN